MPPTGISSRGELLERAQRRLDVFCPDRLPGVAVSSAMTLPESAGAPPPSHSAYRRVRGRRNDYATSCEACARPGGNCPVVWMFPRRRGYRSRQAGGIGQAKTTAPPSGSHPDASFALADRNSHGDEPLTRRWLHRNERHRRDALRRLAVVCCRSGIIRTLGARCTAIEAGRSPATS